LEKWPARFLLENRPINATLECLLAELIKIKEEAGVVAYKREQSRKRMAIFQIASL